MTINRRLESTADLQLFFVSKCEQRLDDFFAVDPAHRQAPPTRKTTIKKKRIQPTQVARYLNFFEEEEGDADVQLTVALIGCRWLAPPTPADFISCLEAITDRH